MLSTIEFSEVMTGDTQSATLDDSQGLPPNDESSEEPVENPVVLTKNLDHGKICLTSCRYDGKTIGAGRHAGQVFCSLCYHAYHKDCVGLINDVNTFWPCMFCRNLAAEVKTLHSKLDSVISQNESLIRLVTQQQETINSLTPVNAQISTLCDKLIPETDDEDENDDGDVVPEGDLLIGDSLLRDVVATDESLIVDSISGAKFNDIRKRLKATNPKKKRYQRLFIVAGTNNTATKCPSERIASDCKAMLRVAKEIAESVFLSSIPPRSDSKADADKISNANRLNENVATEEEVAFVNHDNNFRFQDKSVDTAVLLPDLLHLSSVGVSKLLGNLKLSDKAKARKDNLPHRKPAEVWNRSLPPTIPPPSLMSIPTVPPVASTPLYFHGSRSPLSNFFYSPLVIWNMNFKTSEHAYQYRKCVFLGDNNAAAQVLRTATPQDAKKIGDSQPTNEKWDDVKQGAMYEILKSKARQCPRFHQELSQSHSRDIVEDTPNDFWGRGPNGNGVNMLGKLLMVLRSELCKASAPTHHYTPRPTVAPRRNPLGHSEPRSRQQQLRCFNCGEASHNKSTCRHRAPLVCYSCNGVGHKQKFCQHRA